MANPPKPTRLRLLEGNRGRRPINTNEPQPAPGVPPCPRWLPAAARAEWKRVTKALPEGLLTQADRGVLVAYCIAFGELQWAVETLAAEGRVITIEKSGYQAPHPAVAMERSAWEAVRKLAGVLGLDPSSRTRLSVPEPPSNDPLERFLAGVEQGA